MVSRQPLHENETGRLFAIGDIHGCYREFCAVLDCLEPDLTRDTLVILGDLIDRGRTATKWCRRYVSCRRVMERIM